MNIQPIQSYNISMQGKKPDTRWNRLKERVTQKVLDVFPEHTKKEKQTTLQKMDKFNHFMSKPAENRAIMGATALLTQPFIDYNNKKVDKDTRKIAFINRCAVILAGTTVGMFVVRGPMHKLVQKMTDINGKSKFSKFLLPKEYMNEIASNEKYLKNYRSALSTWGSLGLMLFTNFLLDAPATIFLTNLMQDKFAKKKSVQNKELEVKNV